jgi:hypothetical protein
MNTVMGTERLPHLIKMPAKIQGIDSKHNAYIQLQIM